jgi:hypothetical protein
MPRTHLHPPVHEDIPDEQFEAHLLNLKALREDLRWTKERDRQVRRLKAVKLAQQAIADDVRAADLALEIEIKIREGIQPGDPILVWDANRALDRREFLYQFLHRRNFSKRIQQHLEIVMAKINRVCKNGTPGFFNKLEQNIGWSEFITPLIFTGGNYLDKIVRCGLWVNEHNSRRCHKDAICPNCNWNDFLKTYHYAFGERSGAFHRARLWLFLNLSFTINPANSKCVYRNLTKEDLQIHRDPSNPGDLGRGYDPRPIQVIRPFEGKRH